MIPPSLDLDSMAVASDGATGDGDPIDPPARHSDSRVAAGNRVAALEHYAGEIDPGTRCSGDDDPAFIAVGDPVSARADGVAMLAVVSAATKAARNACDMKTIRLSGTTAGLRGELTGSRLTALRLR